MKNMKKRTASIVIATVQKSNRLIIACATVIFSLFMFAGTASAASGSTEQYIGDAKAKTIALEHSGITEADATFLKVHLDYDDRRVVYDVEFYSGNTEYDYEIDAVNGDVLEFDKDIEYYLIPDDTTTSTDAAQYIGEDKAKAIALTHAGVTEAQATFIKAYLDYDDGRTVYDIDFYSGNIEYDYEIDAVSGEIYEYDQEIEYYTIPKNQSGSSDNSSAAPHDTGNYIGEEKAKSIALAHAGVTAAQVTYSKVHLDYDDGRVDYDIDFYVDNTEYEYEIDAVDGTILEFDREMEHHKSRNNTERTPQPETSGGTGEYIGEAAAKSAALAQAGLTETQVRKLKVKLDREDGKMVYEVEFKSGQTEYEYELDATSGKILQADVDYDD